MRRSRQRGAVEPPDPVASSRLRSSSILRSTLLIAAATTFLLPSGPRLLAQGGTTAAVRGTVRAADGGEVDGALVTVVNVTTGFELVGKVRGGGFLFQGLEVGGPYTLTVELPGFLRERRERLFLSLGRPLELEIVLRPGAAELPPLRIAVPTPLLRANAQAGTATTISDSLLRRLPTLNRDLYDFVRLVPQVSTRVGLAGGGISGGGVGFRFNDFLINGVSERTSSGNVPVNLAGARSLPLEAVKEYRVLLSPYDVRYGDFAGVLVDAVTRSGTNELAGSAFAYWRNDGLARRGGGASVPPHERWQYGFSLGGPIVRDRLHFFVAPELQESTSPAPGPFVGQPAGASPPVPVTESDLARLDGLLRGYGLVAGSAGPVENRNPLRNAFARLDLGIPERKSRIVLWANHAWSRDLDFSRNSETFPLSSYASTAAFRTWTGALQVHTALGSGGGGHNELLISHRASRLDRLPGVLQPLVKVAVPGAGDGTVTIVSGTHEAARTYFDGWEVHLEDHLALPLGASHVASVGFELERFRVGRSAVLGSLGTWSFSSLDSLERGVAERYEIRRDFGSGSVPIEGSQYAAYVGDRWRAGDRLRVTVGIRADLLDIGGRAPYNPVVDSIFGRRTDAMPGPDVHLSPRAGFDWDLFGEGRDRLRGGVGIFTGRPPPAWYHAGLSSYGVGVGTLRCGPLPSDTGSPPPFEPDAGSAPTACATGPDLAASPRGEVDLLDPDLRMARTLRASLAYDRRLPWDLSATGEVLITRNLSDFRFVNLNLAGPRGTDRHGRVLYGGPFAPSGRVAPETRSDFAEVIDLRNTSRNRSHLLSARLEKRFSAGSAAAASYTYTVARDVQTPLRVNAPGTVNWSSRAISGPHDDPSPGISGNDIPHRVILAGTLEAPWKPWSTVLSFYYVGESGSPFTYRAWGTARRGDLNADGSNVNDPIYVPLDAFDPKEIAFEGRSEEPGADDSAAAREERIHRQRAAFEGFIERTPCLRRQRGRILEPNGCREPWSHTTIASVRQTLPVAGRGLEVELHLFNLLNLLNAEWGLFRTADPALLEHVGHTEGPPEEAQPIFRYDTTRPPWTILEPESAFQLQLAVRYRF